MVVGDEDANGARLHHDALSGMVTTIVVPSPGLPWTMSTPPHASARSRIPTRPRELSPLNESPWKPTPLSETPSTSEFPARRTDTSARVALECRDVGERFLDDP